MLAVGRIQNMQVKKSHLLKRFLKSFLKTKANIWLWKSKPDRKFSLHYRKQLERAKGLIKWHLLLSTGKPSKRQKNYIPTTNATGSPLPKKSLPVKLKSVPPSGLTE